MAKYDPLKTFLAARDVEEVPMTFGEIERVIGAKLPPVAFKHRAWWSNNPSNSVITHAWLEAGYRTERVDMAAGKLVFRRREAAPGPGGRHKGRHPAFGALAGTVSVQAGFDLTAPADPEWGRVYE